MTTGSSLDLFHVKIHGGGQRVFDLDQLDAAYKAGLVDESTLVARGGTTNWMRLSELAGLGEPEAPAPESIAPFALDTPVQSVDVAAAFPALASSEVPAALRPRRRGKVIGFAIALAVIGGLGLAGTRARPGLATSVGKSIAMRATSLVSKSEAPRAASAVEARSASATTVVVAPAVAPMPTTETKPEAKPAPVAAPSTSMTSISPLSLPDAKPPKPNTKKRR